MNGRCKITAENGMLVLSTPYDPALVQAVKNLPYTERRYDGTRRVWMVDPRHGPSLVNWINVYMGEAVNLPLISQASTQPIMNLFEVRYIGACKKRDDGTSSAFGMVGNDWPLIFPESVLRNWFDADDTKQTEPEINQTLYQILGAKKSATPDEIKSAYRRMARQWHPDVCREPNAHEMFIRIQEAASILSDPNKRARYDAGLQLQKLYEDRQKHVQVEIYCTAYRSPLRCGLILVEGISKLGRVEVSKILAWEDVVKNGKTLVTSWALGAKQPTEAWV